jgi:rRNA maturation endonuclease Nob1
MQCSSCGAQIEENKKFCTECGTKIEQEVNCPECSTKLPPNTKFCTSCGAKVDEVSKVDEEIKCPKCSKSLPVNSKFCTDCGIKIGQLKTVQTIDAKNLPSDDPLDSIKETGNELMKGVGGLFGKSKSKSKGGMFDKLSSTIDDTLSGKKDDDRGYLRCEKCSGYYKLQAGESPKDYDICKCGGELKYTSKILTQDKR